MLRMDMLIVWGVTVAVVALGAIAAVAWVGAALRARPNEDARLAAGIIELAALLVALGLERAALTADPDDDARLIALAGLLGYRVTRDDAGVYRLERHA